MVLVDEVAVQHLNHLVLRELLVSKDLTLDQVVHRNPFLVEFAHLEQKIHVGPALFIFDQLMTQKLLLVRLDGLDTVELLNHLLVKA